MSRRLLLLALLLAGYSCGGSAPRATANESSTFLLLTNVQVTSDGIFLSQIAISDSALPRLRLGDAPEFGHVVVLTRVQIAQALQKAEAQFAPTNWVGAPQIRITRRARMLGEAELKEMLSAHLQREQARDRGELELRFLRNWADVSVPDELLTLQVLDLPGSGLNANFVARFELRTPREVVGTWQLPVQARIWREIWIARSPLVRGALLTAADLAQERRDILSLRDLLPEKLDPDARLELAENLPAGSPVSMRAVRLRPLVKRGQMAEALLQDGAMVISLKVEVLENGVSGQMVRVRNPETRREFRGKVQNEQIILVSL